MPVVVVGDADKSQQMKYEGGHVYQRGGGGLAPANQDVNNDNQVKMQMQMPGK